MRWRITYCKLRECWGKKYSSSKKEKKNIWIKYEGQVLFPKKAIIKAVQLVFSWGNSAQAGTGCYCLEPWGGRSLRKRARCFYPQQNHLHIFSLRQDTTWHVWKAPKLVCGYQWYSPIYSISKQWYILQNIKDVFILFYCILFFLSKLQRV